MTYKNTKFNESPVMRSFEKLAVKKGLVKPEEIKKTASKKSLDLTPGPNFEENILKLCAGLRDAGFTKQAVEVETKFFNLKKAVHLYDTHGETGDDVIQAAHPDGSHQMKDIDGDAMVETILDKHKAIQNMLAKEPNGKLATARNLAKVIKTAGKTSNSAAVNAIKILFAQEVKSDLATDLKDAANSVKQVVTIAEKVGGLSDSVLSWAQERLVIVQKPMEVVQSNPNDIAGIKSSVGDAISATNALLRNLHPNFLHNYLPNWLNKGVDDDATWNAIESKLNFAVDKLKAANEAVIQQVSSPEDKNQPTSKPGEVAATPKVTELQQQYASLKSEVGRYMAQIKAQQSPNSQKMLGYLGNVLQYLNDQKSAFDAVEAEYKDVSADAYAQRAGMVKQKLDNFAAQALSAPKAGV